MPTVSIDLPASTYNLILALVRGEADAVPGAVVTLVRTGIGKRASGARMRDQRPLAERVASELNRVLPKLTGHAIPFSSLRSSLRIAWTCEADAMILAALPDFGWVRVRNKGTVIRYAHKDHIPAGFEAV